MMRGFGLHSVENVGWLEKEKPIAGPLDAIVRPIAVAPCTSDVHVFHGGSGPRQNIILGHEAVGEVVEVGNMVTRFKPGDRVVVGTTTPDWLQPAMQGKYTAHDTRAMGSFKFTSTKDGVFAEFFHVNCADANMVLLPDTLAPEEALMVVDMMSTGFHGIESAEVSFGEKIVVIGIGPVGLMSVAGAQLRGASQIVAIGTRPNCVRVAKEYGATDIISYKNGDLVKQVLDITDGGADKVIIAGGTEDTLRQSFEMCKAGGIVSNVNFFDIKDTFQIPAHSWRLGMANIDVRGGFCPGGSLWIGRLIRMLEYGRVDASKLISHTFHGFDKIEEAFRLMDEKPADVIKPVVLIDWDKE